MGREDGRKKDTPHKLQLSKICFHEIVSGIASDSNNVAKSSAAAHATRSQRSQRANTTSTAPSTALLTVNSADNNNNNNNNNEQQHSKRRTRKTSVFASVNNQATSLKLLFQSKVRSKRKHQTNKDHGGENRQLNNNNDNNNRKQKKHRVGGDTETMSLEQFFEMMNEEQDGDGGVNDDDGEEARVDSIDEPKTRDKKPQQQQLVKNEKNDSSAVVNSGNGGEQEMTTIVKQQLPSLRKFRALLLGNVTEQNVALAFKETLKCIYSPIMSQFLISNNDDNSDDNYTTITTIDDNDYNLCLRLVDCLRSAFPTVSNQFEATWEELYLGSFPPQVSRVTKELLQLDSVDYALQNLYLRKDLVERARDYYSTTNFQNSRVYNQWRANEIQTIEHLIETAVNVRRNSPFLFRVSIRVTDAWLNCSGKSMFVCVCVCVCMCKHVPLR